MKWARLRLLSRVRWERGDCEELLMARPHTAAGMFTGRSPPCLPSFKPSSHCFSDKDQNPYGDMKEAYLSLSPPPSHSDSGCPGFLSVPWAHNTLFHPRAFAHAIPFSFCLVKSSLSSIFLSFTAPMLEWN